MVGTSPAPDVENPSETALVMLGQKSTQLPPIQLVIVRSLERVHW
jgi:hypothetical protein